MMFADILDIEQAFSGYKCIDFINSPYWVLEKVQKKRRKDIWLIYSYFEKGCRKKCARDNLSRNSCILTEYLFYASFEPFPKPNMVSL